MFESMCTHNTHVHYMYIDIYLPSKLLSLGKQEGTIQDQHAAGPVSKAFVKCTGGLEPLQLLQCEPVCVCSLACYPTEFLLAMRT